MWPDISCQATTAESRDVGLFAIPHFLTPGNTGNRGPTIRSAHMERKVGPRLAAVSNVKVQILWGRLMLHISTL